MNSTLKERLEKAWKEYIQKEKELHYPNIMIVGGSGKGKSSLVNLVFNMDIASVSNTKPETIGFNNVYDGHDYNRKINIIDTEGYELGNYEKYHEDVINAVNSFYFDLPVQVVWYCISLSSTRIEKVDIDILKELCTNNSIKNRIAIVFTQCEKDDQNGTKEKVFKEILEKNDVSIKDYFDVSIEKRIICDLDNLIEWSSNQFQDDDLKRSFISSQMINLDAKREAAKGVIKNYSTKATLQKFLLKISEKTEEKTSNKEEQDNTDEEIAAYIMKMISEIISTYGIDQITKITKELDTPSFFLKIGDKLLSSIIYILKYKLLKSIITAFLSGIITKTIGEKVSEKCYEYVKKIINNENLVIDFEDFLLDDENSKIITNILNIIIKKANEESSN